MNIRMMLTDCHGQPFGHSTDRSTPAEIGETIAEMVEEFGLQRLELVMSDGDRLIITEEVNRHVETPATEAADLVSAPLAAHRGVDSGAPPPGQDAVNLCTGGDHCEDCIHYYI